MTLKKGQGTTPVWKIWRTVTIGTENSVQKLRESLDLKRCQINQWAGEILDQPGFALAPHEENLNLALVSGSQLGFEMGPGRHLVDIYRRAISLGLKLCPLEVGPQLRKHYQDQPLNEWLVVATEKLTDKRGDHCIFQLGHDHDGLWLLASPDEPEDLWFSDARWIFRL